MAKLEEKAEADAYRFYMSDLIYYGIDGKRPEYRYSDLLGKATEQVDTRTGDEIAQDVITRLGISIKQE